jgi:hypothetical protein
MIGSAPKPSQAKRARTTRRSDSAKRLKQLEKQVKQLQAKCNRDNQFWYLIGQPNKGY